VRARLALARSCLQAADLFDVPPLIDVRQIARAWKSQVEEAKAAGVQVIAPGGGQGGGQLVCAGGVQVAPEGLAIMREETFGPAFSFTAVAADEAEAVRRANDSEYGLSASVDPRPSPRRAPRQVPGRGHRHREQHLVHPGDYPRPWSGRKASGHGTTNSHRALAEMVRPRFRADSTATRAASSGGFDDESLCACSPWAVALLLARPARTRSPACPCGAAAPALRGILLMPHSRPVR
jgi:acyl-CoA reductase-like NAD-dependent aldehyde dehydrogenase